MITPGLKRLGWILDRQGIPTVRLEPLRAAPIKGSRVLNPTGPRRGPYNTDWSIQVNWLLPVGRGQTTFAVTAERDRPLVAQRACDKAQCRPEP